ncbi:hypothetical protein PF003_g5841 [Phytophthora fragariae]|nr:hypothetical protein PF003_g5841 [Phytophthora fragariae]
MRVLSLWLLVLVAVAAVEANVIVDDDTCYRNKKRGVCEPESLCEFNFNIGDLNFNQSCRVKDGVNFVLNSKNDVPTEQTALIQAAFEELFLKYEVDVVLAGHKHYYERELPVANSKAVMDGVSDDYAVYDNPQAPVHILTGGAGQVEGMSEPPSNTASWNAASDYEHFGFSMLEANRTTLVWNYSEELAKYIAESCANLSNESEEPLDDSDDSSDDDVFDFAESQSADKFVEPPVEVPRSYRTQDLQGGMLVAGDCVLFTNWAFKRQLRRVRRLAPIPERGDAGEYEQLPSDEECRPKGVHSGKIVEL